MSNKTDLTISVITPSYNQADFLPYCLDSVAMQNYAPIEHLVYDPGSTDSSRETALRYPHVTLLAESDRGQAEAVNKGFTRAKGDILAWINSDDCYADEAVFARVIARFNESDHPDIVYGKGIFTNEKDEYLRDAYIHTRSDLLFWLFQQGTGILQPATFIRREVFEKVGRINESLHYSMDYEYWIRCVKSKIQFVYQDDCYAKARYHIKNKTFGMRGESYREVCEMLLSQYGYVNHNWLRRYAEYRVQGFDGVLTHTGNHPSDTESIEVEYKKLLKAYNGGFDVRRYITEHKDERGWRDTQKEMDRLKISEGTPCHSIPLDQATEQGNVCYTVGPRRWAFRADWKKEQIVKTHMFLRERIAQRHTDTCVIVGNGPSLKQTDLSLLVGQDVIISNNAFLNPDLIRQAAFYTVVNYLVAEQSAPYINLLRGPCKILPYWLSYCLNEGDDTYFLDAVGYPEFSTDIFKNASWRHTVSFFNMHLAYGLGYKRVVLVGFDHSYTQQQGIKEGDVITQLEDDINHFDHSYFRGRKWQAADVDNMEKMYELAKNAYEQDGREIVNATVGGHLELFNRMSLKEALIGSP
ncbi:MAG: hypothetical protein A2X46_15940 [Lentisphaerae bacterium GWF2_57_35]|nr:MAG: hypothetical protein A2X46_15940 [Lentisphaerae bacterium GWF2_57_35]